MYATTGEMPLLIKGGDVGKLLRGVDTLVTWPAKPGYASKSADIEGVVSTLY